MNKFRMSLLRCNFLSFFSAGFTVFLLSRCWQEDCSRLMSGMDLKSVTFYVCLLIIVNSISSYFYIFIVDEFGFVLGRHRKVDWGSVESINIKIYFFIKVLKIKINKKNVKIVPLWLFKNRDQLTILSNLKRVAIESEILSNLEEDTLKI